VDDEEDPLGDDWMGKKVCVECSYVSEGCPRTKIPIDLLELHEKFECEFRMVRCERQGC